MDIEIAVGFTHATAIANGNWYQKGFEHDLKLDSPAFSIGFSQPFLDRYRFRAGYEWLGRFTSSAEAVASDANYNAQMHGCNGECMPLSHWYGAGTVQGLYAAVSRELFSVAGIPVSIELGADYYRSTWSMHIPDWRSSADAAPIDLRVEHRAQWQVTPRAGISVGGFNVTYHRDISARGDRFPAIYKGSAIGVDYRWSF